MQIPVYNRRVGATRYRRPVSTLEAEKHLVEARKYQRKAQDIALVGGLVQDTLGVVDNILAVKSATDLMAAETEMVRRENEFFLKLTDPNNPVPVEEWNSLAITELASIRADEGEKLKLRRSKEEFGRRFDRFEIDFNDKVATNAQVRAADKSKSDYDNSVIAAEDALNYKKVKEYTEGVRGWLITEAEADEQLLKSEKKIAESYLANGAKQIIEDFGHQRAKDWIYSDQANEILKSKGIRPEALPDNERDAIAKRVIADWNYKLSVADKEHKIRLADQGRLAADMYSDGTLTIDILAKETRPGGLFADFGGEEQTKYINMIESRPKAGLGGEDPATINDPEIWDKFTTDYYNTDPATRPKDEEMRKYLEKYKGAGISLTNYKTFSEYLAPDDAGFSKRTPEIVDPIVDAAMADVSTFYDNKIEDKRLDEEELLEVSNEKANQLKKLDTLYEENPEWDDEQKQKALKNILQPPREREVKRHLETLTEEGRLLGLEERFPEERKAFYEKEEKDLKKQLKRKLKLSEEDYTIQYDQKTGEPSVLRDGTYYKIDDGKLVVKEWSVQEKELTRLIKQKLNIKDYTVQHNPTTGEPYVVIDGVPHKVDGNALYKRELGRWVEVE